MDVNVLFFRLRHLVYTVCIYWMYLLYCLNRCSPYPTCLCNGKWHGIGRGCLYYMWGHICYVWNKLAQLMSCCVTPHVDNCYARRGIFFISTPLQFWSIGRSTRIPTAASWIRRVRLDGIVAYENFEWTDDSTLGETASCLGAGMATGCQRRTKEADLNCSFSRRLSSCFLWSYLGPNFDRVETSCILVKFWSSSYVRAHLVEMCYGRRA